MGQVDGPAPEWSTERAALLAKDHIEVWIAATPNRDLPPVDSVELKSAQECQKATPWLET